MLKSFVLRALRLFPECKLLDRLIVTFISCVRNRFNYKNKFNLFLLRKLWRGKLSDQLVVLTSDKIDSKSFVESQLSSEIIICPETIAVLNSLEEIMDFNPKEDCVFKSRNGSGDVYIYRFGTVLDRGRLSMMYNNDYYRTSRQENYRNGKLGILVESLIFGQTDLIDYKFFVFFGEVALVQLDWDRFSGHKRCLLEPEGSVLEFNFDFPLETTSPNLPENFLLMKSVAEQLSKNFDDCRIDLYSDGRRACFGEFTHFHGGAGERIIGNHRAFEESLFYARL